MRINCAICGKHKSIVREVINGSYYCKKHYILEKEKIYLDNTDPENLGIITWLKDNLPEYVKNKSANFHLEMYEAMLRLYDPFYRTKLERLLELISWRESGKSTIITMFLPAYILAFNGRTMKFRRSNGDIIQARIEERFIVIVSETGNMAEDFVVRIRDEFTSNSQLLFFHKHQIQNAYDAIDGGWTKRAFKFNGCWILGIGQGMQARGRIKGPDRITLLLADDIYSENNTKTDTVREGIRRWWNRAIKNSVDIIKGKVILMGTIVHEDTVLIDAEKNDMWLTYKYRLMPVSLFDEFLEKHLNYDYNTGRLNLPFDDIKDQYHRIAKQREYFKKVQEEKDWKLSWKDRIGLYELALMIKEQITEKNRSLDSIYQEYFHIVIPESSKRFTKDMFQRAGEVNIFRQAGINWIDWKSRFPEPQPIYLQLGLDIGTGQPSGDDTVITLSGILPDLTRIVIRQIIGKYGLRDKLRNFVGMRYDTIVMDRSQVAKLGYADEIYRLVQFYHPDMIKIGVGGEEIELVEQIITLFNLMGEYTPIEVRQQTQIEGKKVERIANSLYNVYSTFMVWHCEGLKTLEHQLEYLGKTTADDAADSLECSMNDMTRPSPREYSEVSGFSKKVKPIWESFKPQVIYNPRRFNPN